MELGRRAALGLALAVFLAAAIVYLVTLTPTVPFWDSGEFIAVSYILGVPHPPGTPFYVLIGRVATLIPWATVAERVNALSAVSSALAILLTYLTILRLVRLSQGRDRLASAIESPALRERRPAPAPAPAGSGTGPRISDAWIAQIAAIVGALLLAYSDSFWENSIEAEVYSMMSLAQVLVFWLGLRWWEAHEKKPTVGPLLLCVYVMWLSVGLHLGVGIMGLPLLLLVALVDRRAALVFLMPYLTVLLVTMGLERMAGGLILLSSLFFLIYTGKGKLNGWVAGAGAVAGLSVMPAAFGDAPITPLLAVVAVLAVAVPLALLARRAPEGRVFALALLLMIAGYSTHVYLPIRAAQHPAINEGDPSNWDRLRDLLERKQYGQMNMFVRRAPWSAQINKEFWRYFKRQWPLWQMPGDENRALPLGAVLPLFLGIAGAVWQARRERTSFLTTACFFGLTTAGMIVFLNFTDHEVRDRDYFFQSGYHAFALWMGLGTAWLITWVRDSFQEGPVRLAAGGATAGLMLLPPVLLLQSMWYTHDRRGNYVAHDYAYNMLEPLDRDSFVYTNGDNDTFPLWYMQQVENLRKDVRVVNLSLLNTDWYIRQLRDEEPKVPMALSDADIQSLGQGGVLDEQGRFLYTNQFMVRHIVDVDRDGNRGWKKQPYFAVTVPEHMGLDKNFTLEALVYRVNPDTTGPEIDVAATRKNLYEVFKYRGLFTADGSWDSTVYKDENASTLSRNYAAAHLQLAFHYRRRGQIASAIGEMERVARMFPDYLEVLIPLGGFYLDVGDTTRAAALFQRVAARNPNDPEALYYYGVTLVYQHRLEEGIRELESAIRLNPNYNLAYYAAYYSLWEDGQHERALAYLDRWVSLHPTDDQAQQLLETQRRQLGGRTDERRPLPRPPAPALP